ncbi:divergent PAP2 family protein [Vibrio splendidus]|uniref:divergent PAP2 family protein n=1 Tax=Vibrio splendidus TaxID=29497 RepID=UPI0000670612|nr:divergent PAP2 family protein [Vibrio splendidus]EAP95344.1 hypothetical protein V12B01_01087 [Vibrio splendidus 12B01]
MDLSYIITPFFAWLVAGCMKFSLNTIKERRLAFNLIGYGGMPSNHSSIVSSAVAIIILKEGINTPILVVALTVAFIVMLDANSLREQVGKHANTINKLSKETSLPRLRERMGHSKLEILAGIFTGFFSAFIVYIFTA